jgi:hypothetical protein
MAMSWDPCSVCGSCASDFLTLSTSIWFSSDGDKHTRSWAYASMKFFHSKMSKDTNHRTWLMVLPIISTLNDGGLRALTPKFQQLSTQLTSKVM